MKVYRDRNYAILQGKGTTIELDGNELARAVRAYLYAHGVFIVDPSGRVLNNGEVVR